MKKYILLVIIQATLIYSHQVVENLNIEKFMGRWYVISLIPNWIEEGGTNSFDDYKLNKDGTIDITYNTIKNNEIKTIKQKGIIVDKNQPSRWEIKFIKPWIPFFKAPYEVIVLDSNYNYMAVGYPDNTYGWIMSRDTYIIDSTYNQITDTLEKKFGYKKNDFKKVLHTK